MLRAHEVSPFGIFGFIENGSKRADLDAFLRLALFLHITISQIVEPISAINQYAVLQKEQNRPVPSPQARARLRGGDLATLS